MTAERVVVTGGSGFIGSHLTDRLLQRGHDVTVFDCAAPRDAERLAKGLRIVVGDVRDRDAVRAAVGEDVRTIFHLSAIVGVPRYLADPLGVIDVNIGGTRNVLEAAERTGATVILASTSEIYGKNPKAPWAETDDRVLGHTGTERWSYSTSKAVCEHLALAMHRSGKARVIILRYFNVYGPRQAPIFVISQSVRRALRGEPPLLYDLGASTRCFTYVDDVVDATLRAAVSPKALGEVFNVGSDRETTVREVIETVLRAVDPRLKWQDVDTAERFGSVYEDIPRRVPDVRKIRDHLGWAAQVPLREGVARTVAWARQNTWWLE